MAISRREALARRRKKEKIRRLKKAGLIAGVVVGAVAIVAVVTVGVRSLLKPSASEPQEVVQSLEETPDANAPRFAKGTMVNGVSLSEMTAAEAK